MAETPTVITAEWLNEHLDDEDLCIIDATVHLSFDENGAHIASGRETYEESHLPGAVFVDQLQDLSDPDGEAAFAAPASQVFADVIGRAGVSNGSPVVVYDHVNGIWATRLWWHFRLEGFDNVVVLDGGRQAWQDAGFALESGPVAVEPATFTPTRRPELIASTADVEAATTDKTRILVNSLDAESFAAGHIPGSVNVPFVELVDEAGRLKSPEELRAVIEPTGALDPDVSPITYCGGGIAATAVALALTTLGRNDVAVYDGSMNAWTADPNRPLETA